MKKNKNLILIVVSVLWFFFSFTFADDCNNIGLSWDTLWNYFSLYFSSSDLEIARSHLKSYCEKKSDYTYIQSTYWYDHILDVMLRKLDAREASLYSELAPDEQWLAWVKFITDVENIKNPEKIREEYKKYRTISTTLPVVSSESQRNLSFLSLQNTASLSLIDKYINSCFLSLMIYYKWLGISSPKDIVIDGDYDRCMVLIKKRIAQETDYATSISQYGAADMLLSSWDAYTNQFIQNRLMKLFDKISQISLLFNSFKKQAPLVNECTK